MASYYTAQGGDTWASIAAAQLGNVSLAATLAAVNGYSVTVNPPAGLRIALSQIPDLAQAEHIGAALLYSFSQTFARADFLKQNATQAQAVTRRTMAAGEILMAASIEIIEQFTGDNGITLQVLPSILWANLHLANGLPGIPVINTPAAAFVPLPIGTNAQSGVPLLLTSAVNIDAVVTGRVRLRTFFTRPLDVPT